MEKNLEFQKNHMKFHKNRMKFQAMREKMEFVDFSLIGPVSDPFTNCFTISLRKYCAQRKYRIKILKTVRHRHRHYLCHTVFRFPIYSTGSMQNFLKKMPKKPLINFLLQVTHTVLTLHFPHFLTAPFPVICGKHLVLHSMQDALLNQSFQEAHV